MDIRRYWWNRLIFVDIYQMLNNLWLACCICTEHFRPLRNWFSNVILTWAWVYFLFFNGCESFCTWLKYRMWPWNLKYFYIFCLAWDNYLFSILIFSNVICSRTRKCSSFICIILGACFHCSKRDIGFRYFDLPKHISLVAARANLVVRFSKLSFSLTTKNKCHIMLKLLWNLIGNKLINGMDRSDDHK